MHSFVELDLSRDLKDDDRRREDRKKESVMEELKLLLPQELKRAISNSSSEDLDNTCRWAFQVVRELTDSNLGLCKKSRDVALDFKQSGNNCYVHGDYAKALGFYSRALRHAPTSSDDMDKTLLATLYTNRASSMLNLDHIEECKRDCSRAITIYPLYVKARFRRGKAHILSKNYEEAVHDLEAALEMEKSVSGKRQIKTDLDLALKSVKSTALRVFSPVHPVEIRLASSSSESCESMTELHCKEEEDKGRGMFSLNHIPPSTLLLSEEPLAAIVLKTMRETHCHFCLNDLPSDAIFCSLCTIPSYCSEKCREAATGRSDGIKQEFAEHRHECGGANWSAVLPSDVVLTGRVMSKIIYGGENSSNDDAFQKKLDFIHHYGRMALGVKVEFHILSAVLSCCLNNYFGHLFPFNEFSVVQLVIIMSQIKVNSMAIVHMKCLQDLGVTSPIHKVQTTNIEQVRVGQALYCTGRLFNHSCLPNIHAYFLSRRLFMRSTEPVAAGFPLELSYGPQVGQLGFEERQRQLKEQYFFTCHCKSCSNFNFPDIVINAFRCKDFACHGAVPEIWGDNGNFMHPAENDEIMKVGRLLYIHNGPKIRSGSCLSCGLETEPRKLAPAPRATLQKIRSLKECPEAVDQAVEALHQLRSVRHAYSRDLAQAEDMVAEMFCSGGDLKSSIDHSKASLKILEKLYKENHIAIGNELVKLASLQRALGDDESALDSVGRLEGIFSLYYGRHAGEVNPFIKCLH
ncbi:tetratricopeptide repeat (TPR)-like superfamily protein isoform X2 [Wolffia australiana]